MEISGSDPMDGVQRIRRPGRLQGLARRLVIGALVLVPLAATASPQLSISPLGYRIEQVKKISSRVYEVTGRAGVANAGPAALDVTADLRSGSVTGLQLLDSHIGFGNVGPTPWWAPVISRDTFRLRLELPKNLSLLSLLLYLEDVVGSLYWELNCGNCGSTNRPPVAHAGEDQTAYVGQQVTLDGSRSSDPDGDALRFDWSMISAPPGSQVALSDPAALRPVFTPDREGEYVFRLIVNDGIVDSSPSFVTVSTLNSAPVARAGADQTVRVGARVRLDGSASSDIDGDALTYEWTLLVRPVGSEARFLEADPASPFAEFIVDKPGEYLAELVVHDGTEASVPDTVTISTENSLPVADAGSDRTAHVGEVVHLTAGASTDADGDPLTYLWSMTVPPGSLATLSATDQVDTSFTVDKPGVYLVQLIVYDGFGDSEPDTVVVSTINSAPVADAGENREVEAGEEVMLDGSASHDADGDPLSFNWSLTATPPGSETVLLDADTIRPRMRPDLPGDYVGQLIVSDGELSSMPSTVTITAREAAPPDVEAPAAPDGGLIDLVREDAARVLVSGRPGSVEGGAQVLVSNFDTGDHVVVEAGADGSFAALLAAADDDAILVAARDAAGNLGASTPVSSPSALQLTIDTPAPHAVLSGSTVLVSGTLRAPPNTGVMINGRPAAVFLESGSSFYELLVELAPSQEYGEPALIEVVATTPDGRSVGRTATVTVNAPDAYTLRAAPADGPAPLRVEFQVGDNLGGGISDLEFDFDGDGVPDGPMESDGESFVWTFHQPGTHVVTATFSDLAGERHTVSVPVHVYDPAAFSVAVRAVWDGMVLALGKQNLPAALARFNASAQERFKPAFEALHERLPQIVSTFSVPYQTEAGNEVVEYVIAREIGAEKLAFFVYLSRGSDGVWRIAGM